MAWLSKEWNYRYPVLVPFARQALGNFENYRIWLPKEWSYFWDNIIPSGADIRVTDWTGNVELEYELGLVAEPGVSFIDFNDSDTTNRTELENRASSTTGVTTDLVFVWIYWGNPDAVDNQGTVATPLSQLRVCIESPSTYANVVIADEDTPASTGDAIVECRFEDAVTFTQQSVVKPPVCQVNEIATSYGNGLNIYWRATEVRGGSFYTNKFKRELQSTEIMRVASYVVAEGTPETPLLTPELCVGEIYGVVQTANGELLIKIQYLDGTIADPPVVYNACLAVETYLTSTEPEFYEHQAYPRSRTPRFGVKITLIEPAP